MIINLAPNLMVKDVNKSVEFYCDVLGFGFILGVPEGSRDIVHEYRKEEALEHAMVRSGNVEFMFHRTFCEEFAEFAGHGPFATMSAYMVVDGLEKFYQDVKSKTIVFKELESRWYGMKEFYIKDPDNYILGFGERMS